MKDGVDLDFRDFIQLKSTIDKLGKLPQKCVTKAAKKGASIIRKAARGNAPVETGVLKSGIVLKGEKTKTKGKKVYQITFSRDMNDVFQKKDAQGNIIGYYPVSQEYGYFTRNGKYIPGYRFMRNAAESNEGTVEKAMSEQLLKEVDKEWKKKVST